MQLLELTCGATQLSLSPWLGGGIAAFTWRGHDVFRPYAGDSDPLALASFPMVPFCNRIAHGQLPVGSGTSSIPLLHKDAEPEHALHGLGWVSPWAVTQSSSSSAILTLHHDGAVWPWSFEAHQEITARADGYVHKMAITNLAETPMPAGLGLHPYFPRAGARLKVDIGGLWENGADRLPSSHRSLSSQPEWLTGPSVDNCYTGRRDAIEIAWPTHRLTMHPSANLPFTHVYCPAGEDFFCVEPVSHIPDAVNSSLSHDETGLKMLQPGESMEIECRFTLEETT